MTTLTPPPPPVLALPPVDYDVAYLNMLVRQLNFYIHQLQNHMEKHGPTKAKGLDVVGAAHIASGLNLTGLPSGATLPGGLVSGDVWRDTSTTPNTLRIVP